MVYQPAEPRPNVTKTLKRFKIVYLYALDIIKGSSRTDSVIVTCVCVCNFTNCQWCLLSCLLSAVDSWLELKWVKIDVAVQARRIFLLCVQCTLIFIKVSLVSCTRLQGYIINYNHFNIFFTRFTGTACDTPFNTDTNSCDRNPCLFGGTCHPKLNGGYTCTCAEGYLGDNCEAVIRHCSQEPCGNHGICVDNPEGKHWYFIFITWSLFNL